MTQDATPSRGTRRTKGPVPLAAVVSAVVLLAAEAVFLTTTEPMSGVPVLQPTADVGTVIAKRQMMAQCGGAVVLVGDSSCLMGLDPRVIAGGKDADTGGRVVNLGTLSSLTLAGYAMQVRELMALPQPPRAVVLAVLPQAMEVTAQQAEAFGLAGRYRVAYGHEAVGFDSGWRDRGDWWFYKHRFNRFPAEFGGSFSAYRDRLTATHGFIEETKLYNGADARLTEFNVTPLARQSLEAMAQACAGRGVPLYLWWSPKPEDAVSEAYARQVQAFTAELAADGNGPIALQTTAPRWPVERFGSINHLRPDAAVAQSLRFSERLRQHQAIDTQRFAAAPAP